MATVLLQSLKAWWPEMILSAGALAVMLMSAGAKRSGPALAATWLVLAGAAAALWTTPVLPPAGLFFGLITCDAFSLVFRWLALGTLAVAALLIGASRELEESLRGESLGLLLAVGVGLMLMAEATHLLMAYVSMELVSLSSYILVGFLHERRSAEASLKYLLFGALSSGIMLFGMSLLFGLTGMLGFADLARATAGFTGPSATLLLVASAFLLAGLAFKVSMVPFHMWTPDAYEGAPVAVTAFLSVGPKAAGLALLIRVMAALGPAWPALEPLIIGLAIATMTLGNLAALVQTNVKRLLAYSTIGQVGYLLIGFAAHNALGLDGLLVYLVAYLFMNLGAFACVVAVVNDTGSESLDAFRGLSQRAPAVALLCTLCLLSLAGMPPLLGFFGKFLLFGSAIASRHPALAVAAALNSAAALYYYVNLIRLMYLVEPVRREPLRPALGVRVALAVCAAVTLWLGLFPSPLLRAIHAIL